MIRPAVAPTLDEPTRISKDALLESGSADRSQVEKKKNGIFYTPDVATRILARWAIRNIDDNVIEPSFGGCGFLAAACDQLIALGNTAPAARLYGCDLDAAAFDYLARLFSGKHDLKHFIQGDFLNLSPSDFHEFRFDVVIGNPPYVSLHNMSVEQRTTARSSAESRFASLSKKASLWAYFILHSMTFMKTGGRMAWVLPGSFLHAEYAVALREKLGSCFRRSVAIQLEERLFLSEGTEESSVILLCEGYQDERPTPIRIVRAVDLNDLQRVIAAWTEEKLPGADFYGPAQLALLGEGIRRDWHAAADRNAGRLKDYMTFRIGIVTGASRFFVMNERAAESEHLPADVLHPVVARFAHCRGLELNAADWKQLRSGGARCLLFSSPETKDPAGSVATYLMRYPEEDRTTNKTFQKRTLWHEPYDGQTPDAFFSAMQSEGPTLVLNTAGVACTNTLYRVVFHDDVTNERRRALAISLQSTMSQLSAEIEGRSYGSGGLKLEPSEAGRVLVWLPNSLESSLVSTFFSSVDMCLRSGDRVGARRIADELLISSGVFTSKQIEDFSAALSELRRSRYGSSRQKRLKK